jgi:DNA-binding NarL/FixJ family response regulator
MPYSLVLADDHQILRDGIKAILARQEEFVVVAEAANGLDAIQICKQLRPDLVLMEIALPGVNGVEVTAELLRHVPATKVLILSMYDDEQSVVGSIRAGARAYVLKRNSASDLLEALRMVAHGGSYLSPQVSDRLLRRIQRGDLAGEAGAEPLESLSPRELQVMRLVTEGHTSKEIAALIHLGLQTVRSYRKTLMRKLGVTNAASLTQLAVSAGMSRPLGPKNTA